MTEKTQPTDAELKAMWQPHAADIGGIFYYARAVLAKWGQPAQAAEPVAYSIGNTLKWHEGKGLTNAQLFAAPQPVEREPLTPERVKEIVRGAGYDQCGIPDTERAAFINGLRHGEQAHGIKKRDPHVE